MPERFKANIYELEGDDEPHPLFEDAVAAVEALPKGQRLKGVNGVDRRLEHYEEHDGCLLLNFVTMRFPGPGKASRNRDVEQVGLQAGESFAHQTAMLYDAENGLVLLESGRPGMGPGAVGEYIGDMGAQGYRYKLTPRFDGAARSRALRAETIRLVEMRVALGADPGNLGDDLGNFAAFAHALGGDVLDIQIKVGRSGSMSLLRGMVHDLISRWLSDAEENGSIEKVRLKGRTDEDEPYELIDLIQHREARERLLEVDQNLRNVPHEERWEALLAIRRDFLRVSS